MIRKKQKQSLYCHPADPLKAHPRNYKKTNDRNPFVDPFKNVSIIPEKLVDTLS